MSWEHRRNGKFYYRARRVNGRVVKEYVGSGAEAEEAAKRDAEEREEARKLKEAFLAKKKEYQTVELMLDIQKMCIEVVMNYQMTAAGYHRVNRGPWRKKRVKKNAAATAPSANPEPAGLAAPPPLLPQSG